MNLRLPGPLANPSVEVFITFVLMYFTKVEFDYLSLPGTLKVTSPETHLCTLIQCVSWKDPFSESSVPEGVWACGYWVGSLSFP